MFNVRPVLVCSLLFACVAGGSCALRRTSDVPSQARQTCRDVLNAADPNETLTLAWRRAVPADAGILSEWCATVGPAVIIAKPTRTSDGTPAEAIAIVSWNTHVGGGDVSALIQALESGQLTSGRPVRDFVLLLQEVYRAGPAVPDAGDLSPGAPVPDRIVEHPPSGSRRDIVSVAQSLGLALYYVPSMRNGERTPGVDTRGPHPGTTPGVDTRGPEDRGNAILSTRPLSAFTAIELPFEKQRRVAIAANLGGAQSDGGAWQLRVASAHLDASAGARRLWVFASGARARQAKGLVDSLDLGEDNAPTVVGSDLNTWAAGPRESAYRQLRQSFPQTQDPAYGATFRGGLTLDYMFFRLPQSWRATSRRAASRFGSDHHPVVGSLIINSSPHQP
jgi:endonuclease/exonuclease/phosphatase family metal-dependent hydrolase